MLSQAVWSYGIRESVLTGLACNIYGFSQLLKNLYFEFLVDHKTIEHLWKGKKDPTANTLTALLLKLWDYMFHLKYQQVKKTFASNILSSLCIEAQEDVHTPQFLATP